MKAKFEEAMELCGKHQKQIVKKGDKDTVEKKGDGVDLFAKLKPKAGSWDCEACYVNNPPEVCMRSMYFFFSRRMLWEKISDDFVPRLIKCS